MFMKTESSAAGYHKCLLIAYPDQILVISFEIDISNQTLDRYQYTEWKHACHIKTGTVNVLIFQTYLHDGIYSTRHIVSHLDTVLRHKSKTGHKFRQSRGKFPDDAADCDLNYFAHHKFTCLTRTVMVCSLMTFSGSCSGQIVSTPWKSSHYTVVITLICTVVSKHRPKQVIMSITKIHQRVFQNTKSIWHAGTGHRTISYLLIDVFCLHSCYFVHLIKFTSQRRTAEWIYIS